MKIFSERFYADRATSRFPEFFYHPVEFSEVAATVPGRRAGGVFPEKFSPRAIGSSTARLMPV
ncbi:MAG: hypothetical protein ACOY90_11945 [Candidatus Zhuqueibacterota bacterium]